MIRGSSHFLTVGVACRNQMCMKSNAGEFRGNRARAALDALREGIASGRWGCMLPGELKLCEELHFSRNTIRKALNRLREEGVLGQASRGRRRSLGAVAAATAAHSAGGFVGEVGLIIREVPGRSYLFHEYTSQTTRVYPPLSTIDAAIGVLREDLETAGHALHIHRIESNVRARGIRRIVSKSPAKVWILLGCPEHVHRWFCHAGLPVVVMGPVYPKLDLPFAAYDNEAIGCHLASEFIRLGHRRVVVLQPDSLMLSFKEFADGIREVLERPPWRGSMHLVAHSDSAESVRSSISKFLDARDRPTAIVTCDPVHVLPVFTCLIMHGLRVPADVAIVSRMADVVLGLIDAKIDSYRFDGIKLGRAVAEMALCLSRGESLSLRRRLILPERVRGDTLGPAAGAACALKVGSLK